MRGNRSVPRAGVVVVVLLAALLHVLGCAHGPTTAPALQTDALVRASSTTCGQRTPDPHRETTAGAGTPAPSDTVHCWGLDQPTVQSPRAEGLTRAGLPDVFFAGSADIRPTVPVLAVDQTRRPPTGCSPRQTRASLGVWRT